MSRGERIGVVLWAAAFAASGLVAVVLGATRFVRGFEAFDTRRSCIGSSACVARFPATVEGASRLAYDGGRRHAELEFPQDGPALPELGTEVVLERWHGRNIAVFDPRSEQLSKTLDWPKRWDGAGIWFMLIGSFFVGFAILFVRGEHTAQADGDDEQG